MFIAMNRFRIARGYEAGFEKIWQERGTFLDTVPGFRAFTPLRGPERDDHVLDASHSRWERREAF